MPLLPVMQVIGKDLVYNREKTLPAGAFYDIGEQIPWTANVDYTQVTVELKRAAVARVMDLFLATQYPNVNDYRTILISEARKGLMRTLEDFAIYGDKDNNSAKEYDGLHALVNDTEATTAAGSLAGGELNIDMGETALALNALRLLLDSCKVNQGQMGRQNVAILVPHTIGRRLDEGYQEAGFVRSGVTVSMGTLQLNGMDLGGRIMTFDGIPIIRSDFLVAEQLNTGMSSTDAKDKWTSGTKGYSLFVVRFGPVETGGLSLLAGNPENGGVAGFNWIKHVSKKDLEDYDADGERLVAYSALALGSTKSLGRITDITDVAVTP